MKIRTFGQTGMRVSALGFGTAEIGPVDTDFRTVDALLGVAHDCGINVIDTAAMYLDSEEKLGRALQGRRNQFFIFTKCGRHFPPKQSFVGFWLRARRKLRKAIGHPEPYESLDWHPSALEWDIDQSLRRLRTDRIDLIQLHSCSEETLHRPEIIEVLQRARQAGKVLHIGYSGDGGAASRAIETGAFEALQISINVADQEAIEVALPLARQSGLGVIAKRPLANGIWRSKQAPSLSKDQKYWERLRNLQYDFLNGECDFSMALRFALSVDGVHTAIVGTTNPEHLRVDAACAEAGPLMEGDYNEIRARWKTTAGSDWVGQM